MRTVKLSKQELILCDTCLSMGYDIKEELLQLKKDDAELKELDRW